MNPSGPNEDLACDECGRYGVFIFDGHKLCPACYATGGSCCPEFGRDEATDGPIKSVPTPSSPIRCRP